MHGSPAEARTAGSHVRRRKSAVDQRLVIICTHRPDLGPAAQSHVTFGPTDTFGQRPRLCCMNSMDFESRDLESRALVFSALGDPTRLSILDMLSEGERCVCDIQGDLNIAPNLLSYHLRVLREAGLVDATRRGRWMDYRIAGGAGRIAAEGLPSGFSATVAP